MRAIALPELTLQIEKYAHHIAQTEAVHERLSGAEVQHAQRYTELLHAHYQHSVLDSLPEGLRSMTEPSNDQMSIGQPAERQPGEQSVLTLVVTRPKLDTPVMMFCRKDCGEIMLEG